MPKATCSGEPASVLDNHVVKISAKYYKRLERIGEKTGLSKKFMTEEALDWWLEFKAPILVQHAEETSKEFFRNRGH